MGIPVITVYNYGFYANLDYLSVKKKIGVIFVSFVTKMLYFILFTR